MTSQTRDLHDILTENNEDTMKDTIDWTDIPESRYESFLKRLELVETILDTSIDERDRLQARADYKKQHNVSERTIRNYIRRYREHGQDGLLFFQKRKLTARISNEKLSDQILRMIEERPSRTVPQLRRLLTGDPEYSDAVSTISDRTLYRFLAENGFSQKKRSALRGDVRRRAYHEFQAPSSLHLVQGDARDGIYLPDPDGNKKSSRKTYLFAWIDDFSRMIVSAKYYWDEKLPRMEDSFKNMILRWGIPAKVYLDNGSVYISRQFAWILKDLKIQKIHHPPYQAWCKGKVEALMKTIKNEFQGEAAHAGFQTIEELNTALWAWIDVEYNRRNHSSTGEAPLDRFRKGLPENSRRITDLKNFEDMFLLRETRTVSKYGNIKLCSNKYNTTSAAHGMVIEVRYNPFDLHSVYRFENGTLIETLELRTLVNEKAPHLPEEKSHLPEKISAESAQYFSRLREKQKEIKKISESLDYTKLKGEKK